MCIIIVCQVQTTTEEFYQQTEKRVIIEEDQKKVCKVKKKDSCWSKMCMFFQYFVQIKVKPFISTCLPLFTICNEMTNYNSLGMLMRGLKFESLKEFENHWKTQGKKK